MSQETTCGSHENSLTQQPMDRTITTRDDLVDEVERRGVEIERLKDQIASAEGAMQEMMEVGSKADAEVARLTAALNRYRYVYHWWASDSYDSGREFKARMSWARGEDIHQDLSNDELAKIGQQFLAATGRRPDLRERGRR